MSVDQQEHRPIEEKVAAVGKWLSSIQVKEGAADFSQLHDPNVPSTEFVTVPEIEPELLRDVLEHFGADFSHTPERDKQLKKLRQKNNLWRREGMDAVWGKVFMDKFNTWTVDWANRYEAENNRVLPTVEYKGKQHKTSGLRHVLGHLTAYPADEITWSTFKKRMAGRVLTGYLYANDKQPKDLSNEGYTGETQFPGSIPPEFIPDFWNALKNGEYKAGNE